MWQNMANENLPKEDSLMKQMARQLLASEEIEVGDQIRTAELLSQLDDSSEKTEEQLGLRSVKLDQTTGPVPTGIRRPSFSEEIYESPQEELVIRQARVIQELREQNKSADENSKLKSETIQAKGRDISHQDSGDQKQERLSETEELPASIVAELEGISFQEVEAARQDKSVNKKVSKRDRPGRDLDKLDNLYLASSPLPSTSTEGHGSVLGTKANYDQDQAENRKIRQVKLLKSVGLEARPIKEAEHTLRSFKIQDKLSRIPRPRRFKNFSDVVAYAQDQLPTPKEMQLQQKREYQTWLMAKIATCDTKDKFERFAYSLDYKDLAILFPTLATLKTGEEIDKLLRIIVLRASKYLYIQGWLTLQYAYPRSTVQKGLALLCEVLEDKGIQDQSLNLEEVDILDGLDLGPDNFDWRSVHLISEISLPNTRHFMSTIIKFIRDSEISGANFFKRYGIYRDLSLGQAIINQWDMAIFESNLHEQGQLASLF